MRAISALLAGLVGTVFASPTSTKTTSSVITYSTKPAYPFCKSQGPFASVDGRLFDYNGTKAGPRYFAGTNTWWLSHILSDQDVNTVLSEIKNVCRPISGTSSCLAILLMKVDSAPSHQGMGIRQCQHRPGSGDSLLPTPQQYWILHQLRCERDSSSRCCCFLCGAARYQACAELCQ